MRKKAMRVLAAVCDYSATISDFFEGIECYRLSRAFHRVYNGLDDLHWALYQRRAR